MKSRGLPNGAWAGGKEVPRQKDIVVQRRRPTQETANSLGGLKLYAPGEKRAAERCRGGAKGRGWKDEQGAR